MSNNNDLAPITNVSFSKALSGSPPNGLRVAGVPKYTCTDPATGLTASGVGVLTQNIHSKPHDEHIAVQHKPFDAKIWQGLTELLQDPEKLKAQLERKLERKHAAHLPAANADTKTDKDLEKLDIQEKRILDAYRESIIDLEELKSQKAQIAAKRKTLEAKKKAIPSHRESAGHAEITWAMLGDVSARFQRAMAKADFAKREKLVNLLVNSVTLYTHKANVKGNIPVVRGDVLNLSNVASSFFCSQESPRPPQRQ